MTDSWKADSRFISRSQSNSSAQFVSAELRANDVERFSHLMVNEGSNENNARPIYLPKTNSN